MRLHETLLSLGMSPPQRELPPGRWIRFPGIGKGRANRAGWCRVITPTLAIYGDWSSGLTGTWRDEAHIDSAESKRLLQEARSRETEFLKAQREQQRRVAEEAREELESAFPATHSYLALKGFPELRGFVRDERLLIPMRDAIRYHDLLNVQQIWPDGEKRFLSGGRAKSAIYRLGSPHPRRIVLCEGYATGLSLDAALKLISPSHAVIVCFSANNLVTVAGSFPHAVVAADHDESGAGQEAAKRTGLSWAMPPTPGDFNDLHLSQGLFAVTEILRSLH